MDLACPRNMIKIRERIRKGDFFWSESGKLLKIVVAEAALVEPGIYSGSIMPLTKCQPLHRLATVDESVLF